MERRRLVLPRCAALVAETAAATLRRRDGEGGELNESAQRMTLLWSRYGSSSSSTGLVTWHTSVALVEDRTNGTTRRSATSTTIKRRKDSVMKPPQRVQS